jgi:hypothetical protein
LSDVGRAGSFPDGASRRSVVATLGLPEAFALDRDGHVVYAHRDVTAADIPPISHVPAADDSASDTCETNQCTI